MKKKKYRKTGWEKLRWVVIVLLFFYFERQDVKCLILFIGKRGYN